ncbi:MAG: hypothetical protein ACRDGM_04750 [bacterium]
MMLRILFALLLPIAALAQTASAPRIEQRVPFALKTVTPEFTTSNWWRFLGIGLNVMAEPRLNAKGQLVHATNEWYFTGKGTPLLKADLENKQEVSVPYGVYAAESIPNDRPTLTRDASKLSLSYRLSLPVSRAAGSAYIVVSGNAPMPAITEGESLRLTVWARATLTQARSQGLTYVGYANTFGGDIFSEYPMRLGLSYRKESGRYDIPDYEIKSGKTVLAYGPTKTADLRKTYADHQRVHSADSPRGLAARNGFVLSPVWSEVSTQKFTVTQWDIGTNVVSFELLFELPADPNSTLSSVALWENVVGTIELSGFRWFKEVLVASPAGAK